METYLALSFASMVLFGITSFVRKLGLAKNVNSLFYLLLETAFMLVILIPISVWNKEYVLPDLKFPVLSALSVTIALFLFMTALRIGPVNIVMPIVSSSFIVTVLLGTIFLKEPMTALKAVGTLLVLGGLYLLQL